MQALNYTITKKDQEILDAIGLKPYEGKRIPSILCPNRWQYWASTIVCMGWFHFLRSRAAITRGPKFMFTVPVVLIPLVGLLNHKMMIQNYTYIAPNSLKLRLLPEPDVKEALEKALEINQQYRNSLIDEIERLKSQ